MFFKNIPPRRRGYIKFGIVLALYLLFLYWVGSWWGLLVVPFIYDVYVSKFINWGWWKNSKNRTVRLVMSWVDAIVFALVAIYFLNQFFFQNFTDTIFYCFTHNKIINMYISLLPNTVNTTAPLFYLHRIPRGYYFY